MYIQSFQIQNFKSFKDITFHFNPDINMLTGVNNSGKTSVLEALALWTECFEKLLWQVRRPVRERSVNTGDYILQGDQTSNPSNSIYLPYQDIVSIRTNNYGDIFYHHNTNDAIILTAFLNNGSNVISIPFEIKAGKGLIYTLSLKDAKNFDYQLFNHFFKYFPKPIQSYFASPVANVLQREKFETLPNIQHTVKTRNSSEVIRNRLYQLKKNSVYYADFLLKLNLILNNGSGNSEVNVYNDELRDKEVEVKMKANGNDFEKNIALMGSGSLQIIEILLNFYAEEKDLTLILLDEPDSHIHRSVQQRLLQILVEYGTKTQIFLTTHNEHLIRSAQYHHVFHLDGSATHVYHNIAHQIPNKEKIGLQPSFYMPIIQALTDNPTSLDFISALECDKLVITEGDDDPIYLEKLWAKKINNKTKYMYWVLKGVSKVYNNIGTYKEIFSTIKNEKSLWDKSMLIFDRDLLPDEMRSELLGKLKDKLNIPIYLWNSYTIESVVLSEPTKLQSLIERFANSKNWQLTIPVDLNNAYLSLIQTKKQEYIDANGEVINIYHIASRIKGDLTNVHNSLQVRVQNYDNHSQILLALQKHIKQCLTLENVHKIATKDDTAQLLNEVFQTSYSQTFSLSNLPELIAFANLSEEFEDWKNVIKM